MSLREFLEPPGAFSEFNREERNAAATLYAALLLPGNVARFAKAVKWSGYDPAAPTEVFVEWTYARDLWNSCKDGALHRSAILGVLKPANANWLTSCSVDDFNAHFGVGGMASSKYIQQPGRWSVAKLGDAIEDNEDFRRTCIFKWAFNIKPDVVVQSGDNVLCIEAKWDSAEGMYPSAKAECAIFDARNVKRVSQTEVQQFLVNELLGYSGTFRYLVKKGTAQAEGHLALSWADAMGAVDIASFPPYLHAWVASLSK